MTEKQEVYEDEQSSIELHRGMKGEYSYTLKVKTFGNESNDKSIKKLEELKAKVDLFIIKNRGG